MTTEPLNDFDPDRLRDLLDAITSLRGGWEHVTDADLKEVQRGLLWDAAYLGGRDQSSGRGTSTAVSWLRRVAGHLDMDLDPNSAASLMAVLTEIDRRLAAAS